MTVAFFGAGVQLDRHEAAVSDATEALNRHADWDKALLRRATSYMSLAKYDEAVRDFSKLTQLHPEDRGWLSTCVHPLMLARRG